MATKLRKNDMGKKLAASKPRTEYTTLRYRYYFITVSGTSSTGALVTASYFIAVPAVLTWIDWIRETPEVFYGTAFRAKVVNVVEEVSLNSELYDDLDEHFENPNEYVTRIDPCGMHTEIGRLLERLGWRDEDEDGEDEPGDFDEEDEPDETPDVRDRAHAFINTVPEALDVIARAINSGAITRNYVKSELKARISKRKIKV